MTSSVRSFYGRFAGLYDALATFPGVARWRERAIDALALQPGETVVELGCGTGANLPLLRERVGSAGHVVGVDITRPLLARARRRTREWPNVHLVQGDATAPPLAGGADEGPDAVLGTFVLGMFTDPASAVDGWCDLVGPGGRVALLEATRSDRLAAVPLNATFDLFVRAGAPSGEGDTGRTLGGRVRAGHRALVARTERRRHESFGLGFLDLLAGTVTRWKRSSAAWRNCG